MHNWKCNLSHTTNYSLVVISPLHYVPSLERHRVFLRGMCGGGVLSRCLVRDFFAGRQCLYPLNRECISRMCRTYLEWLTLHKTAVKKPRERRQTVPLPQWGGRVRAWKQDFQLKRQVINNGRPMLELNGLLQTMEQKITHIALNIFGTSKIDLAFRRTAETTC